MKGKYKLIGGSRDGQWYELDPEYSPRVNFPITSQAGCIKDSPPKLYHCELYVFDKEDHSFIYREFK